MDKPEFFTSLGFTAYETNTLISLTKLKVATPKELSMDSKVPQNKLYSILSKFEVLGILAHIPSDTKKYKLINLKTFIDNRIKIKEQKLKELKTNSKKINDIEDSKEEFIFSLIKGQKAIMNRLAEHSPQVKKEILGVQRNWKYWGEGIRRMEKSVKRGVDVKMIGIINKETEKKAKEWKEIGCKIKIYNKKFGENPLRFSIFDDKEARITIGKPEISNPKDYITIWTKSKPLIAMLRFQFMNMWQKSKDF